MIRVTRTFSIRAYAFCLHWAGSEITHQQVAACRYRGIMGEAIS